MDVQELLQDFMSSSHGQQAASALSGQGLAPEQINQALEEAVGAAHAHVGEQAGGGGVFGSHFGRDVFAAFAAGMVKGDGFFGAIKDGLEGGITGRLTEALGNRLGFDSSTASGVVAAVTPFLTSFIAKKLGS